MHKRYSSALSAHGARIAAILLDDPTLGLFAAGREIKARAAQQVSMTQLRSRLAAGNMDDALSQHVIQPLFKIFAERADPTALHPHKPYKFLSFILRAFLKNPIRLVDLGIINGNLADFDRWTAQLQKDGFKNQIDLYDGFDELQAVLQPYQQKRDQRRADETRRRVKKDDMDEVLKETTIIYDGPEGRAVIPHTRRAAQYWGTETKWCISAEDKKNFFYSYNNRDPIFIFLPAVTRDMRIFYPDFSSYKKALVGHKLYDEKDLTLSAAPFYMEPLLQKVKSVIGNRYFSSYMTVRSARQRVVPPPPANPDWPEDKRRAYDAVRKDGLKIKDCNDVLRADKDIVTAAVRENGFALEYASAELRADAWVVLQAVRCAGRALEFADPALQANWDIVSAAVIRNGRALEFAAPPFKNDIKYVLQAISVDPEAIEFAHEDLRADRALMLRAVRAAGHVYAFVAQGLRADRELAMEAVSRYGNALLYADEKLRADPDVVLTAVRSHSSALAHAAPALRADPAFLRRIIEEMPIAFFHFSAADRQAAADALGLPFILETLVSYTHKWNARHPEQEKDNPLFSHLRHVPELWGHLGALQDIDEAVWIFQEHAALKDEQSLKKR